MQSGVLAPFTAQQLATTAYAFSALDHFPGEQLLGLLAERCLAVRGALDPLSLSHVLWSLARLGYAHKPFYEQLAPLVSSFGWKRLVGSGRESLLGLE